MEGDNNRNFLKQIGLVIVAVALFFSGYKSGKSDLLASPPSFVSGSEVPAELKTQREADFAPFWTAWSVLEDKYVTGTTTKISDQDKVWGAIEGLASSYKDPYTVFLPPEETEMFETEISGNFQGVGMEVGIKDDVLTVIAPLKDTPAERAGIRPGDKILKINDEVSTNMRVDEAVKKIRGEKGTVVRLTLYREGKSEPFELSVTRDVINIPTIDTEVRVAKGDSEAPASPLRDGVFIIRLYNFSANSPRVFRDALRDFVESGSDKLILDLRGNPGGYLEASVDIASWFLSAGKTIVVEDFGEGKDKKIHRSRGYDIFTDQLKMVILVNQGSASASEILAGALQSYGEAKLVGTKTFGKGSVQELVKITPETSLKVTVARWLTPNGISISEGGLTPDVEVKAGEDDDFKKKDAQLDRAIKLLTEKK